MTNTPHDYDALIDELDAISDDLDGIDPIHACLAIGDFLELTDPDAILAHPLIDGLIDFSQSNPDRARLRRAIEIELIIAVRED